MQSCPQVVNHWWNWYPPVGCFIALVAVLAFLYPIIYDGERKISKDMKTVWTTSIFLLVLLEIRSTKLDRDQHNLEQEGALCIQANRFAVIARKLEQDIVSNQQHFDTTMIAETGILATAKRVGEMSLSNLQNVTGGNSFAYVVPFATGLDLSSLMLRNDGEQLLSGVVVTTTRITGVRFN